MRTLDAIAAAATEQPGTRSPSSPCRRRPRARSRSRSSRLGEQAVDGVIIIIEAHLLDEAGRRCCPTGCRSSSSTPARTTTTRSSTPTRRTAPGSRPSTCSTSATRPSGTSPARRASFSADASPRVVGADPRATTAPTCRPCCAATGRPSPATKPACGSPRTPTSPRSSPPTTRWRSACCAPCTSAVGAVPGDVSVVGFDDMEESAQLLAAAHDRAPVLRRGRPAQRRGAAHGDRVRRPRHQEVLVPTELVVRASTSGPSRVRG